MKQDESNQDKSSEPTREEAVARMKQRMEEDERARREERPLPQAERGGMSDFVKGFLLTAVPAVALSVFGVVKGATSSAYDPEYVFLGFWLLAVVAFIVTMVVGLAVPFFKNNRATRAGVLAGIGVAVVSLGVSCFAMPWWKM
jgi:cation transport ATPase